MPRTCLFAISVVLAIISAPMSRLASALDPGNGDPEFRPGAGANGLVRTVAVQSDKKILIGGYFSAVDDAPRHGIARLLPSGAIDTQFVPPTGTGSAIQSIALQSNGEVLIAGWFTLNNGSTWQGVARLRSDGSVDPTFVVTAGPNDMVFAVAAQCDGAIVIGGMFTRVGTVTRNRIARLRSDGTLDQTFNPNANERVFSVSVASEVDSKIVVGGYFTQVAGAARAYVARLNPDGTLDQSFAPEGAGSGVMATAIQSDGGALVAGFFLRVGTEPRFGVARFRPDGSLDPAFNPGQGGDNLVRTLAAQLDGKVLIGGDFTTFAGVARSGVARLNLDGTLDESFNPGGGGAGSSVWSLALQPDTAVLVGGNFTSIGSLSRNRIARLHAGESHGAVDLTFGRCAGPENSVLAVVIQPDDKVLAGGSFQAMDGVARNRIARLNADGTLDRSFDPGTGTSGLVASIALQPDGNIIIAGGFDAYNGAVAGRVARLRPNGTRDPSFSVVLGSGPQGPPSVRAVAVARNGKILIAGEFTLVNGVSRNRIARLLPTGKTDLTFNPGRGPDNAVFGIALEEPASAGLPIPDAKVFITGAFRSVNGTRRMNVARLHWNGRLDSLFVPAQASEGIKTALSRQSDGKVLVAGLFPPAGGVPRRGVARLNTNGTVDSSFVSNDMAVWPQNMSLAVQPDGMVLVGGAIGPADQNGFASTWLVRLQSSGALDPTFALRPASSGSVSSIAFQRDSRIVIGGYFRMTGPFRRNFIARVNP